jgi:hypothetical protein
MIKKKILLLWSISTVLFIGTVESMEIFDLLGNGQAVNVAQLMNKVDFNPNIKNKEGEALIFVLINNTCIALASQLITNPVFNPHIQNKKGESLLSVLSEKGWDTLAKKIIAHKNFDAKRKEDCHIDEKSFFKKGYNKGYVDGYNDALLSRCTVELKNLQKEINESIQDKIEAYENKRENNGTY